jgi:hypothetical protein
LRLSKGGIQINLLSSTKLKEAVWCWTDGWSDSSYLPYHSWPIEDGQATAGQRIRPKTIIFSVFSECSSDPMGAGERKKQPSFSHSKAWIISVIDGLIKYAIENRF